MKKVLYITHLSGKRVNRFWLSSIKAAQELGYDFHLACNMSDAQHPDWDADCSEWGIITHQIDFDRKPFATVNIQAKKQLSRLLEEEQFDVIHCNTPIGGVVGRICAKKAGIKKIIYQAHGFHFWKGAPVKNWLIYYPIEKLLSRWTDILITINKEDYELSKKHMYAKTVEYVPGVGIDEKRFADANIERIVKREELGIPSDATLLLSVGELNGNKNHKTIIKALDKANEKKLHYAIAGKGELYDELVKVAYELGLAERVHLLGFRADIAELYKAADIFVFPSKREGLPVSMMEAMAAGLPIVAARIRGVIDLLEGSGNPMVDHAENVNGFAAAIDMISANGTLRGKLRVENQLKAKQYDMVKIVERMKQIYDSEV